MHRTVLLLAIYAALFAGGTSIVFADRWAEYGEFATKVAPISPTPIGESHIGLVESGKYVPLRFPVPKEPAVGYWISLGNIVPLSGKGTSYQLILQKDSPDGPIIYEGPVITDPFAWAPSNRDNTDITDKINDTDRTRGYIVIFATGKIAGDGWTLYRHNPKRPILAYVAIPTPEFVRQTETAKALRQRRISIIPIPKEMKLAEGDLKLTPQTRIVVAPKASEGTAFAAQELQAMIKERSGLELQIAPDDKPRPGDLAIAVESSSPPRKKEGYSLLVDPAGARVLGADETGCFYGAITLGQMARREEGGAILPHCAITDWPSFRIRSIQYDIARGQTVNVEYVKRMIRELARCKMNALMFYMEDDFRFRKYPFLGREGTFTHEKARELSAFAKQYHVQLIPQFESLGHAAAVLAHPEMKDLREAGGAWVFCTSEPRTWQFLDDVFGELAEAFPNTECIHVGADEFESGFGKCPRCRAKIEKDGLGGLYAEHMNKLNQLVKKRGKVMMFWPSHGGPTPELSFMTLKYQDKLEKDCIPTEWIYHGPASYPEIEQYQEAGFKDVHCCPSVVDYFFLHPEYNMTFRAIRGFYRAAEERGCGGVCCTTWGLMHGALMENSWYGLIYAAECSWSPASTSKTEFDRRFADLWWGLAGPEAQERMADTIFEPLTAQGEKATWRNRKLVADLFWAPPQTIMRDFALKQPSVAENVDALLADMDAALQHIESLASKAGRNQLTLRSHKLAFRMMRYASEKLSAFKQATALYQDASKNEARAEKLAQIAALLTDLQKRSSALAQEYGYFVENCGAYKGDVDRLQKQSDELRALAAKVNDLASHPNVKLPPGAELGLPTGTYSKLGEWTPAQVTETEKPISFDATKLLTGEGEFHVEWQYERGGYGLYITGTRLLCNGNVVSEDKHPAFTGGAHRANVYKLRLANYDPKAKYEIVGDVCTRAETESYGIVWLIRP